MDGIIKNKNIFLFGAGRIGELLYEVCSRYMKISGFVDNDIQKQSTQIKGVKVYSLDEVLKQNDVYIVITTIHSFLSISEQLSQRHLKVNKDFCHYKNFFLYLYNKFDILIQGYVELYITDKCSLKCKKCALMIPYIPKNKVKDIDVYELKSSIRDYFNVVDTVVEFRILGGEPFLYKELDILIKYLGEKFAHQIQGIKIVSNGTVVPRASVIKSMSKYDVEVDVSNYPAQVVGGRQKILLDTLDGNRIRHKIINQERWIDTFGDPMSSSNASIGELKRLFSACKQECRTLYGRKLYFCSVDCAAQRNGMIVGDSSDYIDLSDDRAKIRDEIIKFDLGVVPKGYLSFCQNCNGGVSVNKCYTQVAEQMSE